MTAGTENHDTPRTLPEFEGWTVDVRLRQFRRAEYGVTLEYVPFDSPQGRALLARWRERKTNLRRRYGPGAMS